MMGWLAPAGGRGTTVAGDRRRPEPVQVLIGGRWLTARAHSVRESRRGRQVLIDCYGRLVWVNAARIRRPADPRPDPAQPAGHRGKWRGLAGTRFSSQYWPVPLSEALQTCCGEPVPQGQRIGADDSVEEALRTMTKHRVRWPPVIDGHDLVGVLAQGH